PESAANRSDARDELVEGRELHRVTSGTSAPWRMRVITIDLPIGSPLSPKLIVPVTPANPPREASLARYSRASRRLVPGRCTAAATTIVASYASAAFPSGVMPKRF